MVSMNTSVMNPTEAAQSDLSAELKVGRVFVFLVRVMHAIAMRWCVFRARQWPALSTSILLFQDKIGDLCSACCDLSLSEPASSLHVCMYDTEQTAQKSE